MFRDIWPYQSWQWLEEGCRKHMDGIIMRPRAFNIYQNFFSLSPMVDETGPYWGEKNHRQEMILNCRRKRGVKNSGVSRLRMPIQSLANHVCHSELGDTLIDMHVHTVALISCLVDSAVRIPFPTMQSLRMPRTLKMSWGKAATFRIRRCKAHLNLAFRHLPPDCARTGYITVWGTLIKGRIRMKCFTGKAL